MQALRILAKLSSSNIIEAASLAISVPAIPIAKPTSAFFKAGASFVPSPVTATTFFASIKPYYLIFIIQITYARIFFFIIN